MRERDQNHAMRPEHCLEITSNTIANAKNEKLYGIGKLCVSRWQEKVKVLKP